jgi:hypothetical protein
MKKTRRTKAKVTADAHLRISYHEKICADRMNRGKGAGALLFIILSILGSLFYFFKP